MSSNGHQSHALPPTVAVDKHFTFDTLILAHSLSHLGVQSSHVAVTDYPIDNARFYRVKSAESFLASSLTLGSNKDKYRRRLSQDTQNPYFQASYPSPEISSEEHYSSIFYCSAMRETSAPPSNGASTALEIAARPKRVPRLPRYQYTLRTDAPQVINYHHSDANNLPSISRKHRHSLLSLDDLYVAASTDKRHFSSEESSASQYRKRRCAMADIRDF